MERESLTDWPPHLPAVIYYSISNLPHCPSANDEEAGSLR